MEVFTLAVKKKAINYSNPPETLEDHPFFGLTLDEEQKEFRDAIWNKDKLVVLCNAKAGSGKTQIAICTAELLCKYGRYNGIVYITAPTQEQRLGYLPGTIQQKVAAYSEPLYEAAIKANINMDQASFDNIDAVKNGTAYIQCMSHNYLRGCNFENKVVIIEEAQNYYFDQLKKVLTRMHDTCKVIVIGHTGQNDLIHRSERSGFAPYLQHFKTVDWAQICTLSKNYRGIISEFSDELILPKEMIS